MVRTVNVLVKKVNRSLGNIIIPDPTSMSGFPSVTAEVKFSPRHSMSHCQFTNLCCCVWNAHKNRMNIVRPSWWDVLNKDTLREHLKDHSLYKSIYLDGYFGAHNTGELVDDLRIQAACIVHIAHHDGEWLKGTKHSFLVTCIWILAILAVVSSSQIQEYTALDYQYLIMHKLFGCSY